MQSGRALVIDRSSGRPGLAVFEGGAPVFAETAQVEPARSPEWVAELAARLAAHGLGAADFDCFVCGMGPGSFSGIRAGLSALQGLALPGGRPVYGVASAAALALEQAEGGGLVTVVGDARRSRLWCVTYAVDAARSRVCLADGRTPAHTADDFQLVPSDKLAEAVPDGTKIVSTDWERLKDLLGGAFAAGRLVARAVFPSAEAVGRLGLSACSGRVFEPLPIYLHPAVAVR
ncbi:MAG: tRNA (adenosine(37)-N6)-threonylcarbamoyltransferase complex dimerization subunit type 1 TsaB [Verrucomicrobiota bacterium]|jgi:tRNA threonylcarbamoyladenosine biosynthesis protein TsaB|nr:tRNA (adenosine(37)-N6)-threonylcarbamoyltransferase complex dimerization subunit type 1 TsaB [Verrucomicrobiota bacterium]